MLLRRCSWTLTTLGAVYGCSPDTPAASVPGPDGAVPQGTGGASAGGSSGNGGAPAAGGASAGGGPAGAAGGDGGSGGANGGGGANPGSGGRSSTGGVSSTGGTSNTGGAGGSPEAGPLTTPRTAACAPGQTYGSPLPSNRNATPVLGGFGFTEGILWIAGQDRL